MRDITVPTAVIDRLPVRGLTRFERRALSALLGILILYTLALLPAARGNYQALGMTMHGFANASFIVTGIVALGEMFLRRTAAPGRRFRFADLAWYGVAATIAAVMIASYGIFKQLILPARGFPLDPWLAAADRVIFLGHDPWTVTHAVFGSLWPTILFDTAYSCWMPMMFVFPALTVALVRSPVTRARLLGCWLFSWIVVGTVAAWLLASAGPCYYDIVIAHDPSFHQLNLELAKLAARAHAAGMVIGAQQFQPMLLSVHASGQYAPAGGISAAPSMHVTMATLFAIAGFQVRRDLGRALTVFATLIWVGSIHLGWHYAVDGILGSAMMLAMWRISSALAHRFADIAPRQVQADEAACPTD